MFLSREIDIKLSQNDTKNLFIYNFVQKYYIYILYFYYTNTHIKRLSVILAFNNVKKSQFSTCIKLHVIV